MTSESNWDAVHFFQTLTDNNLLAKQHGFVVCRVSGLQGFEDALARLQSTTAFVCISDSSEGFTELNNTPRTRRIKTIYFAMRHAIDNQAARAECLDIMRELFRQYMTVLIREKTRLQEKFIYLDPRIRFTEIPEYFMGGCACAFFEVAVDKFTKLQFNPEEWEDDAPPLNF